MNYCTYFDRDYLPRGLAMYESLRRYCPNAELWILCLDRESHEWLLPQKLAGVHLIALEELECADPELARTKHTRSQLEYYYTCTPSLVSFVFNAAPAADIVTYLDSDLLFFSDPSPILSELKEASIAIIEHRFPPSCRHMEKSGIYNVGWVTFRRDSNAHSCLQWWRSQCLKCCCEDVENGCFGDQKYLDQWPRLFAGVVVIQHKGANLAPWNLANYSIRFHDGCVRVDEQELIFFHYTRFQQVNRWLCDPYLIKFGARPTKVIRQYILLPYWQALQHAVRQVSPGNLDSFAPHGLRQRVRKKPPNISGSCWSVWMRARRWWRLCRGVISRRYVILGFDLRKTRPVLQKPPLPLLHNSNQSLAGAAADVRGAKLRAELDRPATGAAE